MKNLKSISLILLFLSGFMYAQTTNIPDENFENYLETHDANGGEVPIGDSNSMGNGIDNDHLVLTSRINSVTYLDINGLNIADLTGIEDFSALQYLSCYDNLLSTLDVSQNTALTQLDCFNNQLTDLTVNAGLMYLNTENNQLSTIDVSANTGLLGFSCGHNQLSTLDVSQNTNLQVLYCDHNPLTALDVSQNTALHDLECSDGQITTLDISNNSAVTRLVCYNNQLTILDLRNGNNANFNYFNAEYNPDLTCVFVDDAGYMNTHWSDAIDDTATYVETQAECDDLTGIDEETLDSVRIFPNPFTENITIQVPDESLIKNIRVQNIQGQSLYRNRFTPQIDLSALPSGIYFLSIDNEQGNSVVYKLVKN